MNRNILVIVICSLTIFSGCSRLAPVSVLKIPADLAGKLVYHNVSRGQTLWRISKIYNVDIEDIAKINNISNNCQIEVGQRLVIPVTNQDKQVCRIVADDDFIWPLKGKVIACFGQQLNGITNNGLAIAPLHSDEVVASRGGKVVFYDSNFLDLGKTIIIDHGDGFLSVYGRNADSFVKLGDVVARGMRIARAGSSGRNRTTYLFFQIRKGYLPQNPYYYLTR